MKQAESKQAIHYRRGNGDDGYCRNCGNMKEQGKLFGMGFLNCIMIGLGTKKSECVRHDFTCDLFWQRDEG